MAFLGKGKKEDLRCLAEELGESTDLSMKIVDLKTLIVKSKAYEESFVKNLLETIINTRIEEENEKKKKAELEAEEKKRELEAEEKKRELEADVKKTETEAKRIEFELRKLELEAQSKEVTLSTSVENRGPFSHELIRLMPKFKLNQDDIILYLSLFERQAKRTKVEDKDWVSVLLTLLPSEIVQMIARESEESFEDYNYIKAVLLKRFKMNAESFRKKFVLHQRSPDKSWRDFTFELTNYFQEWIEGLDVSDFDSLKNLMITDQLKRRVPPEVREHFLDDWVKLISPTKLADKLDEYESVRTTHKKVPKEKPLDKNRPHTPPMERPFRNRFPQNSSSYQKQQYPKTPRYEGPSRPFKPTCYSCGAEGHYSNTCKKNNNRRPPTQSNLVQTSVTENETNSPVLTARITAPVSKQAKDSCNVDKLQIVKVKCGNHTLSGIIDSGAQISVVREGLVKDIHCDGEGVIEILSAFGESEITPLRNFSMKIDDELHGNVAISCAVSKKLVNDLLLSMKAYDALKNNVQIHKMEMAEFISEKSSDRPDECEVQSFEKSVSDISKINIVTEKENLVGKQNRDELIKMQREDEDLRNVWIWAQNGEKSYKIQNEILMHSETMFGEKVDQVVLPLSKRQEVLKMAHEIPLAGHLGERKTKQRIKYSFYWPSIAHDVKVFCESCETCQLRRPITYRDRIPIQPIVRPEEPFEVWSIDCIGPLEPPSSRGHKYIICAIDLCSRWAEAIPVKEISAKTTCNALMKIFVQTGFPRLICTDKGTNFTSKLTQAFLKVIGVSPRFSTPGHPESMGAVERWNRTLKDMLNKNIQQHGREWDLHLPYLLFAYREIPHNTTGISPFQLVYGRLPPGPLALLKNSWTGEETIPISASKPIETYLQDLIIKLKDAHKLAAENSKVSQDTYVSHYNLRSKEKSFKVGDKVLILIPSSSHKLLNTWKGPATVIQMTRPHSAKVEMEDGSIRELHINKLRPYVARVNYVGLVFEQDEDFGDLHYAPADKLNLSIKDIDRLLDKGQEDLTFEQRGDLSKVLKRFIDVFNTKPGHAKVDGHAIKVTADCFPKKLRPYRVPIRLQDEVDRQVKELLEWDLIESSDSEWAHPVVCVAKKDGSVRLCVDYRLLNSFTIPDAYPMKIAKELLFEIGKANFITVIDLTKGYWQIPMKCEDKAFTAFVTHSGHYQWKVMPFGLKNAGSTFQKSMDKVLARHKKYCRSYIDDVAIFSDSWTDHLFHLNQVLLTLREAGLVANLEKCDFGRRHVKFLGHIVGSGKHTPDPEKVEVIHSLARPSTKREVRSLLGLASYYRDYIPNFSEKVLPLTNLTKKSIPKSIPWDDESEKSFQQLKLELAKMPSLHTPDLDKPFQLYTDASATAIGACLAQTSDNGKEMPIAFFSKKLTPCQARWSTIEREAFCVLEALKKYDTWIFGAQVQIVSDHNPLSYLTSSVPHGAKLSRWALALQRYNMTLTYRKGSCHGNADALSRIAIKK